MRPQRNSKLNGFERKNKENNCFSLKTIEFTVALRPHLYFASAALLGRAGLGQGWRQGRAGPGRAAHGRGCAGGCQRAGLVRRLGWSSGWWAGCLGWAGAAGQWAGLACRLRWRLSASWCALGLAGSFVGWAGQAAGRSPVGRLPAMARHCLWAGSRAGLALAASGRGCSGQAALVVAGRCELGWASWLVSSAGQFPRPTTEEPPFLRRWQKQAAEECESEGSDFF